MLAAGTICVAEIAKRLGVNRDTFYSYFPRARANSNRGQAGEPAHDTCDSGVLRSRPNRRNDRSLISIRTFAGLAGLPLTVRPHVEAS